MRAVIYARVSEDRRQGRSVAQQEAEGRLDCAEIGADVIEVVKDNDIGASKHSKGTRRGWPRVLELVNAGKVDLLWTWEDTRAQRDLDLYVDLRKLCLATGVKWRYGGRTYDMKNWRDRKDAGHDAVDAEAESDKISERIRRDVRANAAVGRPHGRRLYGYRRIYDPDKGLLLGQEPHPDEAPIIKRIFAKYVGGDSMPKIAADLNRDGHLRPETWRRRKGETESRRVVAGWRDDQVRRVLTNPSYMGKRHYKGTVIDDGGWKPLIDADVWDQAQQRLAERGFVRQTRTARLLTGVARCGVCDAKLYVIRGSEARGEGRRRWYMCTGHYCVAREMTRLDAWVTLALLERLKQSDAASLFDDSEDPAVVKARERLAELKAELDECMELWRQRHPDGRRKLDTQSYARMEADLLPQIAQAEREARRAVIPLDVDVPPSERVQAWWDDELSAEQRREVVAALIASVTVQSVGRGRRNYDDAEYTVIEWRR
jgi:site-specific DNA recombinase